MDFADDDVEQKWLTGMRIGGIGSLVGQLDLLEPVVGAKACRIGDHLRIHTVKDGIGDLIGGELV